MMNLRPTPTGSVVLMPLNSVRERKRTLFFPILYCTVLTAILSSKSDPLVHHGRHFCRTVHDMCRIHALLTQSIIRAVEQTADDDLSDECIICFLLCI